MINPGDKLRQLRQKENIKQTTLAQILEVSQSKVSGIEKNETPLNSKQILVLSEFFKIPASYFFEDNDSSTISNNEGYLGRIQAILTDFKQTSEDFKRQLLDKNTIIHLQSIHLSQQSETTKNLETKLKDIQTMMAKLKNEIKEIKKSTKLICI